MTKGVWTYPHRGSWVCCKLLPEENLKPTRLGCNVYTRLVYTRRGAMRRARRSSIVSNEQLTINFLPTAETEMHAGLTATQHSMTFRPFVPPKYADIKAALKAVFEYEAGHLCYMIEPEYSLDKLKRLDSVKMKDSVDTIHSGRTKLHLLIFCCCSFLLPPPPPLLIWYCCTLLLPPSSSVTVLGIPQMLNSTKF